MYGVVLNNGTGLDAQGAMKRLAEKGVQTRPFFYPMHIQPVFEKFPWFRKESMPVSENISKYGFYLPSGLTITEEQIVKVAKCLKEVCNC